MSFDLVVWLSCMLLFSGLQIFFFNPKNKSSCLQRTELDQDARVYRLLELSNASSPLRTSRYPLCSPPPHAVRSPNVPRRHTASRLPTLPISLGCTMPPMAPQSFHDPHCPPTLRWQRQEHNLSARSSVSSTNNQRSMSTQPMISPATSS